LGCWSFGGKELRGGTCQARFILVCSQCFGGDVIAELKAADVPKRVVPICENL
jgi:hypothetical protein